MDRHAAQHSSETPEWGTPSLIVELARSVLGRIDLDPFSSSLWNKKIKASRYLDESYNALESHWFPEGGTGLTALVNPPGDRSGAKAKRAWELTEQHHREGWLGGGVIWVAFNLGQLRTLQRTGAERSPLHADFVRCIPSRRIPYDETPGVTSSHPSHDTAIMLLPANSSEGRYQRARFRELCRELGEVF